MRDIFISYVEEDNHLTTQLAAGLEAAGYSVWYYERDGVPGASYLLQTRAAIEGCQAVILIISPDSVVSEQVTLEVVRAHESNKKFLPLRTNINHAEFAERRPEWAQALGASTSIAISPENISTVIPRLLVGLRKMNIMPRPELVTNEMGIITKEMIAEATAKPEASFTAQPVAAHSQVSASDEKHKAEIQPAQKARSSRKVYLIAAIAVLVLAGALAGYRLMDSEEPAPKLRTTEFSQMFTSVAKLGDWAMPQSGWKVEEGEWLSIEKQPELAYPKDAKFGDFTMKFKLHLTNGLGASWAVRVEDERNYYLFHLSGPKADAPGYFSAYVVRNGALGADVKTIPFPVQMVDGDEYTIYVIVKGDTITHKFNSVEHPNDKLDGEEFGVFVDEDDNYPYGGVGFRTKGYEQFAISELYVWPPEVRPLP